MRMLRRLHDLPGVLVRDLGRYRRALSRSGAGHRSDRDGWISLCNRIETLVEAPDVPGLACDWTWGSTLHAPEILPNLGRSLLHAAFAEWPLRFSKAPVDGSAPPTVTFVIAHAGEDRLPQLQRTVSSLFGQRGVSCEVVIIDQSPVPLLSAMPEHVIYRHLAKDDVAPGWHKSWAYNVGARLARGRVLVFHDGDICAPTDYASEVVAALDGRGCVAASLQRFLFYLDVSDTRLLYERDALSAHFTPQSILQNWKGGTIAIRTEAFFAVGGFDEGFVDWGGEDDEFYDRCAAIGHCRSGFLPFVHLWHVPQTDRRSATNMNTYDVLPWRLGLPRERRIAELLGRDFGRTTGPVPAISYKRQRAP
jgi:hypothetical protein